MTPIFAGTPDSSASLARLHDAVNTLRHALNKCVVRRSEMAKSNTLNSDDSNNELRTLSQHMLSQTVMVKLAHEAIIRDVNDSRQKIRNDQEELLKGRLKQQNLEYEKQMLQREIAECRAMKSPKLSKTGVTVPTTLFDASESDEAMTRNLKVANSALQDELSARKKMDAEVETELRKTESKRRKLTVLRNTLRQVPDAVRAVSGVVEPVRRSVTNDRLGVGSREELERMACLPSPLYVVAREAAAFREAFDTLLSIRVIKENSKDPVAKKGDESYVANELAVELEVGAEDIDDIRLRVIFRYMEKLGIVVVRASVVVGNSECVEYPTKDLRFLFPHDRGNDSPRASNAHLEDGTFTFDVDKAGGRAFVWANVLCAIECLPAINLGGVPGHGSEWVRELQDMMRHCQFREVVSALRSRLVSIVHLKQQVDRLMSKRVCVKATDIGFKAEPQARIEYFTRLGRGDWSPQGLVRDGDDGSDTEVWSMRVIGDNGTLMSCLIAIEPDYPLSRPIFRVKMNGGIDGVVERDVTDVERCVNEFDMSKKLGQKRELLLGAQVTALLVCVDRLEDAYSGQNEEIIDGLKVLGTGRTRSKGGFFLER